MNIYRVESKWSKELVKAKTIIEAIQKYEKRNVKIDPIDRRVTAVQEIGELLA